MSRSFLLEVSFSPVQLIELPHGTSILKEVRALGISRPAIPMVLPATLVLDEAKKLYELHVYPIDGTDALLGPRNFTDKEFVGFYTHVNTEVAQLYAFFLDGLE